MRIIFCISGKFELAIRGPSLTVLALIMALSASALAAQSTNYEIRYLGFQEGLTDRSITAICHARRGVVWIGTKSGLFRYDGYEMMPFYIEANERSLSLQEHWIANILEDKDHNLWVTVNEDLLVISPDLQHIVAHENVLSIARDEAQNIYASIEGEPVAKLSAKRENGKITILKNHTSLTGQYLFRKNNTPGILAYDLKTGAIRTLINGQVRELPHRLAPNMAFHYLNYGNGILNSYAYSNTYSLDEIPGPFYPMPKNTRDISNPFGLKKILNEFVGRSPGLLPAGIANIIPLPTCVEPDQYGNLWVGTEFGLFLIKKRNRDFQHIDALKGASTRAIFKTGDTLIVSTLYGLKQIDLKTGRVLKISAPFGATWVMLPFGKKRLLLAGEYDALYLADRQTLNLVDTFCIDSIGHQLAGTRLPDGTWWFGGWAPGLWRFDADAPDKKGVNFGMPGGQTLAIAAGAGNRVWAGGQGFLLYFEKNGVSANLLPPHLKNVRITCMLEMGPVLWIGTRGQGLLRFNLRTGAILRAYKREDGLANNVINSLLADSDGSIWISTNQGLSHFAPKAHKFLNFSGNDGLQIEEFNTASSFRDPESGLLFFGGLNGVTYFDPSKIKKNILEPDIFISRILRSGAREGISKTLYPHEEMDMWIGARARFIEFHLGSNDYRAPQQNIFLHRLEGFELNWVSGGNNPVVQYSALPAGDYVFAAYVVNREGVRSAEIRIPLHVQQIFYKTWWFRGMILLGVIIVCFVIYFTKIRQIRQIIQVKKQIADDLHDDMAASLTQISMLAKSMQERVVEEDTPHRIARLSDESIGKLSDIVWAIDDKPQTLEALANRLQDHAETILQPLHIRLKAEIAITGSEANIPSPVRHHLMLIFKEGLHNIVRHTESTLVFIKLENHRKELKLVLENAFEHLHADVYSSGKGLESITKRAALLYGTVKFEKTNCSFRLTLQVPDIFASASF